MCAPEPGHNTPDDVRDEAAVLGAREGISDRRAPEMSESGMQMNGGFKMLMTFVVGLVTALVLPRVMDLQTTSGVNEAVSVHHEAQLSDMATEIRSISERLFAMEQKMNEGGRWTLQNQMEYASKVTNVLTDLSGRIGQTDILQDEYRMNQDILMESIRELRDGLEEHEDDVHELNLPQSHLP